MPSATLGLESAGWDARIVELRDGAASVALAPEIGGSLLWFRWHLEGCCAVDWLRPALAEAVAGRDAGGMACFPLVPYSNRVRDGRFQFDGREIRLPVSRDDPHFEHGHGWRHPWILESSEASRAILRYRHKPDAWPWRYEAEQEVTLASGALQIRLTLRNLSDRPMPAGFGLHPYFPASAAARIEISVTAMWETDAEVLPTRLVEARDKLNAFEVPHENLDNAFAGWSRRARIVWPDRNAALELEADEPLDFLVLYTPQGENFFCAEPVSNATDAFNLRSSKPEEVGLRVLQPGQSWTAGIRFVPHLTKPTT